MASSDPNDSDMQSSSNNDPPPLKPSSSDTAATDNTSDKWRLKIKTPSLEKEVEIEENAQVNQLREEVSRLFEQPAERLCLVYGGKIMKDEESIKSYGVKNQHSIHLVVRIPPRNSGAPASSSPPSATPTTPTGQPPAAAAAGPRQPNPLGGLAGMNMDQLLDNPLIQNMVNNPEMIRNVVSSNPQIQSLMERHPELSHALNNPDVIRQAMQVMRNPAMMQEMMRNYDRALSNLESIPGGFNALQRFYNDYQEPMYNAMNPQNPFATLRDQQASTEAPRAENTEPLPNPWGGGGAAPPAGGPRPNPLADMGAGGMEQMMNQMAANPQLMERAMANMNNPEYMRLVSDPRGMAALSQLNQAYRTLHELAPSMFPFNLVNLPFSATPAGMSGMSFGEAAGGGMAPPAGEAPAVNNQMLEQMFQSMMRGGAAGGGGVAAPAGGALPPPEERFREQLVTLQSMGFPDRAANIRALEATFGDVNGAVERLLQGGFGG